MPAAASAYPDAPEPATVVMVPGWARQQSGKQSRSARRGPRSEQICAPVGGGGAAKGGAQLISVWNRERLGATSYGFHDDADERIRCCICNKHLIETNRVMA